MPLPAFPEGFVTDILPKLATAPDSQISEYWRKRAADLNATNPSAQQVYDFMAEVHREGCCGVSSFVRVLCDVRQFYLRPEDPA